MEFFDSQDEFNEKPKLELFYKYYQEGEYAYLSADDWELLYQHHMFKQEKDTYQKLKFIVTEAHTQHPYSVFFMLRMAEIKCKTQDIVNAIPFIETAKSLAPTDFEVYETAAQIYELYKEWDKAEENYKLAYFHGADKFDILFQMAICHVSAEQPKKGIAVFEKLAIINPNNEFVLDHTANLVFTNGFWEQGISIFNKVIDAKPYSETAWHYLGNIQTAAEKYEDAIFSQEMVLAINEDSDLGVLGLANVYQEMEEYEQAIEWYEKIDKLEAIDVSHLIRKAECFEHLTLYANAKKLYRKAISLDIENPDAWFGIGLCLTEESKYSESLYFLKNAYKYGKNEDSQYGMALATASLAVDLFDDAIEIYETLVRVFPEEYEIWLDYSTVYSEKKDLDNAIEVLVLALFYIPDNHQALYRLAAIHLKRKEINAARKYLQKALSVNYQDHELLYIFEPEFKANKTVQSLIKAYKNK